MMTVAKGVFRGRRIKFRQTMMLNEADAVWGCTLLTSEMSVYLAAHADRA